MPLFFWLGSILFAILLAALFTTERALLAEQRARRRAQVLDAARLTASLLMVLALPFAQPRPLATIALGLAAFAFIAVPSTWALNLGGVDPRWELRRLQAEGAALMRRFGSPMPPDGAAAMRELMADLERVRTEDTAELCDLLASRYEDWIAGSYRPLELGRRVIRIYDLERRLYGDELQPAPLPQDEATFRWRLYRVFGSLVESGQAEQTAQQAARFSGLIHELERYRRADTSDLIDGLEASASAWLELPAPRPAWSPDRAQRRGAVAGSAGEPLWPATSVLWGAVLDESDRLELRRAREA
jgi:hypothetical protein